MCFIFSKALRSLTLKKIKSQLREPSAHQAQLTHNHFIKPLTVLETILSRNTAGKMYLVFSGASVRIILIYSHVFETSVYQEKSSTKYPRSNEPGLHHQSPRRW